jgi:hypothetical protein
MDVSSAKSNKTPVVAKGQARASVFGRVARGILQAVAAGSVLVIVMGGLAVSWGPSLIGADSRVIHEVGMRSLGLRIVLGLGKEEDVLGAAMASAQSESTQWDVWQTEERLAAMSYWLPWEERTGVEVRAVETLMVGSNSERMQDRSLVFVEQIDISEESMMKMCMSPRPIVQYHGLMRLKKAVCTSDERWSDTLESIWSQAEKTSRYGVLATVLAEALASKEIEFLKRHEEEIDALARGEHPRASITARNVRRLIEYVRDHD